MSALRPIPESDGEGITWAGHPIDQMTREQLMGVVERSMRRDAASTGERMRQIAALRTDVDRLTGLLQDEMATAS